MKLHPHPRSARRGLIWKGGRCGCSCWGLSLLPDGGGVDTRGTQAGHRGRDQHRGTVAMMASPRGQPAWASTPAPPKDTSPPRRVTSAQLSCHSHGGAPAWQDFPAANQDRDSGLVGQGDTGMMVWTAAPPLPNQGEGSAQLSECPVLRGRSSRTVDPEAFSKSHVIPTCTAPPVYPGSPCLPGKQGSDKTPLGAGR